VLGREKGAKALPLLAQGLSDAKVGEILGTSRQSVFHFRKKPETQAALDEIREGVHAAVARRLVRMIRKAAGVIDDLMDSEDEAIRLKAAESALDRGGIVKGSKVTLDANLNTAKTSDDETVAELQDVLEAQGGQSR
jgi:hypothetical protein